MWLVVAKALSLQNRRRRSHLAWSFKSMSNAILMLNEQFAFKLHNTESGPKVPTEITIIRLNEKKCRFFSITQIYLWYLYFVKLNGR